MRPAEPAAADEVARRCAERLWRDDRLSQDLGMRLEQVSPGRAVMSMRVGEAMTNGHGICHGGVLATLADSAFAFACNSYDDVTVAAGFDIDFLAPAHRGDQLVAEAVERSRVGRSGLYDVTVRRQDADSADGQQVLAEFRGRSRSLGRPLLASDGGAGVAGGVVVDGAAAEGGQ
jgi:acyl-CoA thioesterase